MIHAKLFNKLPTSVRDELRNGLNKVVRPKMRGFFSQFIETGDLVYDVGANIGTYTNVFTELGAEVISIDPNPICYEVLERRFTDNDMVQIVKKGLSYTETTLPFHISTRNHATSTFSKKFITDNRYKDRKWDQTIEVPVTTLDKLIEEYGTPKFCKIDVEGYEISVLKGLNQPLPFISFEFMSELLDETQKVIEYLEQLGDVRFNYSLYVTYSLRSDKWLSGREILDKLKNTLVPIASGDIYARFI